MHPRIAEGDGVLYFKGCDILLEKYGPATFAKEVGL
jgi:hypothetical protein